MAKAVKSKPKKDTAKAVKTAAPDVRKRKAPRYKPFRLQKKIPHPKGRPLAGRKVMEKAVNLLWDIKKPLLILVAIYAVFSLLFVRGFSTPATLDEVRDILQQSIGTNDDIVAVNVTLIGLVFNGSQGAANESAGIYQAIFVLLFSLALIWMFRQHSAGNKVTAKMALYKGNYPLIPMLLVFGVLALQLAPAFFGSTIYSVVMSNGIAANGYEIALFSVLLFLLVVLSLYLVSSSTFALYIVTLENMTPMRALRSARQLVIHRRFAVMRRILFLVVIMALVLIGIMLPVIFFLSALAPWIFFALTLFALPLFHAYMYVLYRNLL